MLKLLQGFKDFILRGNVIDLSVGIVVGAAFTGLVDSFTSSWIKPLLQIFGANTDKKQVGGSFHFAGSDFPWSTFVNGLITFLITAAVLYFFVVLPVNKFANLRKKDTPEEVAEEIALLREIRDALRERGVPAQRGSE